MKFRWNRAGYIATAVVFALTGPTGPVSAETLADAMVKAYQTSPFLESSRAALRSLDEGVPQASAARKLQSDASLSAASSTRTEDLGNNVDPVNELRATLNARLVVLDSGQTKAAVEAARYSVAAGRADLKDVEQFVLFNAVQAYVDVRRDEEFVRLAQNDIDRLEETLRATENRFEVGEVTRTDVSQSEARLAASRSDFAAASGSLEVSRSAYLAAVGNLPNNLETLPALPDIPATLEEATAIAMQHNPQIVAAQFNERVAVYDFDRARAAKGPSVRLEGSFGARRGNGIGVSGRYDGEAFGEIGVIGSMPLYNGGANDSLIRQAQALLDQRRYDVQDTGRTVVQDVAAAWAQLNVSRASFVARQEQAVASRIAAEGVAEEARLGARSTLDVLDADQERLEAEALTVQALRDEYVAVYGLLRSMGLLTVEHLQLGIETYDPDVNYARVESGPLGGFDTSVVDRIRARWER